MLQDLLQNLEIGFSVALLPANLGFCLLGALIGTLVGVLPGIGALATFAMLLPVTYYLSPESALIMLAGIYYGAQYGSSTTAILVNMPGESSSVVVCLDGHQMAKQGRAGAALAVAALGSFFAGCVGTLLIAAFAQPLSSIGMKFGPTEYCSFMILGLIGAVVLAQGSLLKAVAMTCVGLLLGMAGTDIISGTQRFTFGIPLLADGLDLVPLTMGLFGLAEIIINVGKSSKAPIVEKIGRLWLSRDDVLRSVPAILRGTTVGSAFGILPGGGAMLSSFSSYVLEKKLARDPARFGRGAIEGVAGPEAANNAGAQTSFIPMLTLGIPSNAVMALMVGAMMIQGIQPGPQVATDHPQLFWGIIASMWVGNLMLVIINLPLIGLWVQLLRIPYRLLYPAIVVICCVGVYSVSNESGQVIVLAVCALFGYFFTKLNCEVAPLLLGFILGPLFEDNLKRAMLLSRGDPLVFLERPISLALLLAALALLAIICLPKISAARERAFQE